MGYYILVVSLKYISNRHFIFVLMHVVSAVQAATFLILSFRFQGTTQGTYTFHRTNSDDTPTGYAVTVQCYLQKCATVIDITNVLIVFLTLLT
jgi:hypothetical protein